MAKSLIFSGNVWTSLKASDTQMQAEWLLPLDTALSFQQKARHQPRVPSRLTSPITCAKLQSKAPGSQEGLPCNSLKPNTTEATISFRDGRQAQLLLIPSPEDISLNHRSWQTGASISINEKPGPALLLASPLHRRQFIDREGSPWACEKVTLMGPG